MSGAARFVSPGVDERRSRDSCPLELLPLHRLGRAALARAFGALQRLVRQVLVLLEHRDGLSWSAGTCVRTGLAFPRGRGGARRAVASGLGCRVRTRLGGGV